jgi:dTDP-4-dehydrorhamnose reductase
MKILILGGDGMLGHQLLVSLQQRHDVRVTLRQTKDHYQCYSLFNASNSYFDVDVRSDEKLKFVLSDFKPHAVINAVGVIKQRQIANEAIPNIEINALFPHRLANLCEAQQVRLIHFSTDCVFSGKTGQYTEKDLSDAKDYYGKCKYLGEVIGDHCLTLRSSVIGLELARKASLIEWFLAQKGNIKGFRKAIYSGLTTQEMSRVIEMILVDYPTLSGLWHVSAQAINKFELLSRLAKMIGKSDVTITPDDDFVCDRSLLGEPFTKLTGYQAPSWELMLSELAQQVKEKNRINERGMPCNA